MKLVNYRTNEVVREATIEEFAASVEQSKRDGGAGVVDGHFVEGDSCEFAAACAVELARQIKEQGGKLGSFDKAGDLPDEDYVTMKRLFGAVTPEMDKAYKKAYNEESSEEISVDEDLCERWLGRDWAEVATPAEAMRICKTCEEKESAGDKRDYNEIRASVMAELGL